MIGKPVGHWWRAGHRDLHLQQHRLRVRGAGGDRALRLADRAPARARSRCWRCSPLGGVGGTAATAALYANPVVLGANGGALALLIAWAIPDLLDLRAGEEIEGDLLGTAAIAVVVALMPLAAISASWIADGVGVLARARPGSPARAQTTLIVPAGPSTRRPISAPGTSRARSAGTAASRPPEVIASHTSHRRGSGTVAAKLANCSAWARLRRVPPATARSSVCHQQLEHAVDRGDRVGLDLGRQHRSRSASSCRWPSRPKPVTSVSAWAPASRAAARAVAVERRHHLDRRGERRIRDSALDRRRDGSGAERLGQHERVADLTAGVRHHLVGMDDAGDRHAVLRARRPRSSVPRGSRRRPPAAIEAPPRRISISSSVAELLNRERDQVQRADRGGSHRVDVRQRVGGGDPAEVERVIDDRGEEVDRLDDRQVVAEPVDAGVIGGLEPDQDVGVGAGGEGRASSGPIEAAGSLQPQPAPCESEVSETATDV